MKRLMMAALAAAMVMGGVSAAEARYDRHRGYGHDRGWHHRPYHHHRYYYRHGRRYWR